MSTKQISQHWSSRMYCDKPDRVSQFEDAYQSDCSRLIYSPSFRRLQGKTQLYPNGEYDYFRSRLTHSLEVNEIAQCICTSINQKIGQKGLETKFSVCSDVVRFACLAHDLGHPPFGHDGEEALNKCMEKYDGFDGNAQTFRILTRIEKGGVSSYSLMADRGYGERVGLNITYRSLASVLKHVDKDSNPEKPAARGFYPSEAGIVEEVFTALGCPRPGLRTIECQIMDISDDISNAVHDLDDSLKSGLLNPFDLFFPQEDILEKVARNVFNREEHYYDLNMEAKAEDFKKIYCQLNRIFEDFVDTNFPISRGSDILSAVSPFYKKLRQLSSDGAQRSSFINSLKNRLISSVNLISCDEDNPLFWEIGFDSIGHDDNLDDPGLQIQILKLFHRYYQCDSTFIEYRKYRGIHIVTQLFDAIKEKTSLMPDDYRSLFESLKSQNNKTDRNMDQYRCICDYIAGMTDRYCLELYGRLFSETPQSIFKPI